MLKINQIKQCGTIGGFRERLIQIGLNKELLKTIKGLVISYIMRLLLHHGRNKIQVCNVGSVCLKIVFADLLIWP